MGSSTFRHLFSAVWPIAREVIKACQYPLLSFVGISHHCVTASRVSWLVRHKAFCCHGNHVQRYLHSWTTFEPKAAVACFSLLALCSPSVYLHSFVYSPLVHSIFNTS